MIPSKIKVISFFYLKDYSLSFNFTQSWSIISWFYSTLFFLFYSNLKIIKNNKNDNPENKSIITRGIGWSYLTINVVVYKNNEENIYVTCIPTN